MPRRNEISSIKDLLGRYKERMRAPQGAIVHAVAEAIRDVAGMDVPEKNISYTVGTRTIGISLAGPQKSEIILQRARILSYCKEALGPHNAPKHIV